MSKFRDKALKHLEKAEERSIMPVWAFVDIAIAIAYAIRSEART
jgi:hypothetical protein